MSLDVYLYGPQFSVECTCSDCGHKHSTTRRSCLYEFNITHNLNHMADVAGIYYAMWRPALHVDPGMSAEILALERANKYSEAHAIERKLRPAKASELVARLRAGLAELTSDPARFRALNPSNGWGTYEGLVEVVRGYLAACEANPDATVEASR